MDRVGTADAEDDKVFLDECFVDTGALTTLLDVADARAVVVGRTGSGKTALLLQVARNARNHIAIKPESLALAHISNSMILGFLQEAGVELDIFFRLLWRHVFTVELLQHRFSIGSQEQSHSILKRIIEKLDTQAEQHKRAVDYLRKWGHSFWKTTDYRTKEVTTSLERELTAAIGPDIPGLNLGAEGARRLSEGQRVEVVHRAQEIVNHVQIRELSDIIGLVDEVLDNAALPYYITIDRLDEDWVDEQVRLRLIRALIETVRSFRKVKNLKIIVALRVDLLRRMFKKTRSAGFQEEKYSSLNLELTWGQDQLQEVLDKRVGALVKRRYTKAAVRASDVLPDTIDGVPGVQFVLERCMGRPRDAIMFFNDCIAASAGSAAISRDSLKSAEAEYSRSRLRALADEWHADHKYLVEALKVFAGCPSQSSIATVQNDRWDDLALRLAQSAIREFDEMTYVARKYVEEDIPRGAFRAVVIRTLFSCGAIGVKLTAYETYIWADQLAGISSEDVTDDIGICVHPSLWRCLGIRPV